MRDFRDIAAFLAYMEGAKSRINHAAHTGLTKAAKIIEIEAKKELGHYQDRAGNFVAWAELADSTKDQRVKQGFSENDPGLRTGEMRESIHSGAEGHHGVVGSDSEHLVWFDQGTTKQPPRSVLGIAAIHKTNAAVDTFAGHVAHALAGKSPPNVKGG